jgi:hypothetical protein
MTTNAVVFDIGEETTGADRGAGTPTCLTAPPVARIVWANTEN